MCAQSTRAQSLIASDHNLPLVAAELDDVKPRASGNTEPFALTDCKAVNARVRPDHFAGGCDQFA